jgi:hypothetical protein
MVFFADGQVPAKLVLAFCFTPPVPETAHYEENL